MSTNFQASFSNTKWTCQLLTGHLHNLCHSWETCSKESEQHLRRNISKRKSQKRPETPEVSSVTHVTNLQWSAWNQDSDCTCNQNLFLRVRSCPGCFSWFCSRQAAHGRVWVKHCVVKFGTNSFHYSSRKCMLVENKFWTSSLSWKLILKVSPAPDEDQTASRYWRNSFQQMQILYCLQEHPRFVTSTEC